ncbi:MAG: restriction endonuclease subunit S, partial [Terrisporobacter sp.]
MNKDDIYVELGEVCVFINGDRGKNYPSGKDFITEGVPFINAGHIQNNNIDFKNMNYISREKFEILGSGKVKKDDILYCLRGSLGKNSIVNISEGAIASSLVILRPKENIINTNYLIHCINSKEMNEQIYRANNGSSQPNLSAASVKKFNVYLPSYIKQVKIANVLDKAQNLIDKRKEQIRALDELVKSQF